ncbi:MAG: TRAP transporter TatT component family protein [Polyangiaceae bacterium]
MKSWVGYGYAFPEDEYEAAVAADNNALAEYHKGRAQHAYDRALFYGMELLARRAEGFDAAKRDLPSLKAWLDASFTAPEDAETLFWVANAWLARVNIAKEDPEQVARLWVGVAMMERSVALDPTYMGWGGTATLASYHARSGMAELDLAKTQFETAIAKTNRKALLPIMNYGARYGCVKNDRALYEKLLKEVVDAGDVDPENRLQNMLAKRRASRYLKKSWMLNECGFE